MVTNICNITKDGPWNMIGRESAFVGLYKESLWKEKLFRAAWIIFYFILALPIKSLPITPLEPTPKSDEKVI
jgi:hypothetical protein